MDAQEGRLTLERSSVAVEPLSTTGEGRANGDNVTGGKVQSEEGATTVNDKVRSEVPHTKSLLCTTAEKAATGEGREISVLACRIIALCSYVP